MTPEQLKKLEPGDIIRHVEDNHSVIVTGNYGKYAIAVSTLHVVNPEEWHLVSKNQFEKPYPGEEHG